MKAKTWAEKMFKDFGVPKTWDEDLLIDQIARVVEENEELRNTIRAAIRELKGPGMPQRVREVVLMLEEAINEANL